MKIKGKEKPLESQNQSEGSGKQETVPKNQGSKSNTNYF